MRLIGYLETERVAGAFGQFLSAHGIQSRIEPDQERGWAIWVVEEEQVEQAKLLLTEFNQNPALRALTQDRSIKGAAATRDPEANLVNSTRLSSIGRLVHSIAELGFGPLTVGLILVSVAVFVLTEFGRRTVDNVPALFITHVQRIGFDVVYRPGLVEVRAGQVWRLVTPIFVHFDFLHLFFNLFWLQDLAGMIESRLGTWRLARLVVVIAIVSNFAQFTWTGPVFGGMSGVVYGLIGYIWLKSKFDPGSGLVLHPWTVAMAGIWFLLCLAGAVRAANAAHAVGFLIGTLWGYISGRNRK